MYLFTIVPLSWMHSAIKTEATLLNQITTQSSVLKWLWLCSGVCCGGTGETGGWEILAGDCEWFPRILPPPYQRWSDEMGKTAVQISSNYCLDAGFKCISKVIELKLQLSFSCEQLGPEKGVIHLATAAVLNAVWDLWARAEGKVRAGVLN